MTAIVFVLAAAVGGLARWQATQLNQGAVPWGTLGVNVAAAFVAGILADASSTIALIAVTAFLGSTSTFSTLTGELVDRRSRPAIASAYLTLTLAAGVGAAWLGLAL